MSWPATSIHVIDFEGSRRSGVVEYGVATLEKGEIISTHTRLCAPAGLVTPSESALHGIRPEDVAHATSFSAELELFAQLRQTGPFAAHHAPVERGLLRQSWPVPPPSPDFSAANPTTAARVSDWGPWLDTRRIFERLYTDLPSYQLGALINTFSLADELSALARIHCAPNRARPHCALFDALAAALLLARLTHEPSISKLSLAWLAAQSTTQEGSADLAQDLFLLDD